MEISKALAGVQITLKADALEDVYKRQGQHEAIISEEDWYLAQEKRKINSFKREKVNNPDHAHILSGILKCPCCGKSMYGKIAKAHSKDKNCLLYTSRPKHESALRFVLFPVA